jgi:hypothetical protein
MEGVDTFGKIDGLTRDRWKTSRQKFSRWYPPGVRLVADALINHIWVTNITKSLDSVASHQCVGLWVVIQDMDRNCHIPDGRVQSLGSTLHETRT